MRKTVTFLVAILAVWTAASFCFWALSQLCAGENSGTGIKWDAAVPNVSDKRVKAAFMALREVVEAPARRLGGFMISNGRKRRHSFPDDSAYLAYVDGVDSIVGGINLSHNVNDVCGCLGSVKQRGPDVNLWVNACRDACFILHESAIVDFARDRPSSAFAKLELLARLGNSTRMGLGWPGYEIGVTFCFLAAREALRNYEAILSAGVDEKRVSAIVEGCGTLQQRIGVLRTALADTSEDAVREVLPYATSSEGRLERILSAIPGYNRYAFQPDKGYARLESEKERMLNSLSSGRWTPNTLVSSDSISVFSPNSRFDKRIRPGCLGSVYGCISDGFWRNHLQCEFVRVHYAMICFKKVNGAFPDRLERLVPEYLAEVPTDPYGGEPMRYSAEKRCLWVRGPEGCFRIEDIDMSMPINERAKILRNGMHRFVYGLDWLDY